MSPSLVRPTTQAHRPKCSLRLSDADLSLGNANYAKGLQSMSDWCWSGHLTPAPFPNNLARYLLHIPGVFEEQLAFSTSLIFDEPSFRNGVQSSGFVDRVSRELAISFIAQKRRCWYSMTHHALLGYFTAKRHGLSDERFAAKWTNLVEFRSARATYSALEFHILEFVEAFATDAKCYSETQYAALRAALEEDNHRTYVTQRRWVDQLAAARGEWALARLRGANIEGASAASRRAATNAPTAMKADQNKTLVDSQVVELAFLCMQFVALSGVLTALNIPDEAFLADAMTATLPGPVISHLNQLCELGGCDIPALIPNRVKVPIAAIEAGDVRISPARPLGTRIPLSSYEVRAGRDPDKGLTVGGVQVGTFGWSFGAHYPGSLVYCLALHPELARHEAPYSLPLLFNEDEWRNGAQTAGFLTRLTKELVFQKVYRLNRSRYGLEHHTMFLFNSVLDSYGVGGNHVPGMTEEERVRARRQAVRMAELIVLHVDDHQKAPPGVFDSATCAILTWVEAFMTRPHEAWRNEPAVRRELDEVNQTEIRGRHARFGRVTGDW
jgi:alkylhydroperoxidase family enzyme